MSEAERLAFGSRVISRRALIGGVASGTLLMATRHVVPHSALAAPAVVISRGSTSRAVVALTFDCGSNLGYTGSVLDTAAAYGVPISFGVTGAFAAANPSHVARMVNEGHLLINHSYSHPYFTSLSSSARLQELESTETALINASGRSGRPYFRPPYGDYNSSVLADVGNAGFTHSIMWTIDVLGWNGLSRDQVINRALGNHGNGYIYLMHVGSESQEGPALPTIIEGLRNRGYGFVRISDMIGGQAPPPTGRHAPGTTLRATSATNLRTAASLNSGVITTMPAGTVVTVVSGPSPSGGYSWYQVDTPYGRGWVAGELMEVTDGQSQDELVRQLVEILIRILEEILSQ